MAGELLLQIAEHHLALVGVAESAAKQARR